MKPIEVIIPREMINRWQNCVHVANHAMKELQARGAPIEGGLFPLKLASGRVVIHEDDFEDLVVRWEP